MLQFISFKNMSHLRTYLISRMLVQQEQDPWFNHQHNKNKIIFINLCMLTLNLSVLFQCIGGKSFPKMLVNKSSLHYKNLPSSNYFPNSQIWAGLWLVFNNNIWWKQCPTTLNSSLERPWSLCFCPCGIQGTKITN